jgi:hypothetical protein
MPEAINYVMDMNSNAWKLLEDTFAKEYNGRGEEIQLNWDYYNGKHRLPLKIQQDGYNDNVVVNHIETLADKSAAFLIGDGVEFDASAGDETSASPEDAADQAIELMWQASRGAILQQALALAGCIEGHNAVRFIPVEGQLPKLQRLQGKYFTVFWDALDMSRVLWYRLQYLAGPSGKRIDYVRGRIDGEDINHDAPGWTEIIYTRKNQQQFKLDPSSDWRRDVNPVVWEYDFAPIVDWQNLPEPNEYYGRCDVDSAIKLNDALNFILSNMQRIIKHFAAPKTVGIGFNAGDVVMSPVGGFMTVPVEGAQVFNLEMQSDLQSSMQLAGIIASGLWQSGGMVDPQTLKDRVGTLTNFGLRVLYSDAIKRIEKKRLLYGEAFELINQRGLTIAGMTPPEQVETIWPDVLPVDDQIEVATLTQELQAGIISKETYRDRRGIDNEKELDRLASENTNNGNVGASILGLLANNRPFNRGA